MPYSSLPRRKVSTSCGAAALFSESQSRFVVTVRRADAEAFEEALAGSPVRVTLVKPGPTDTPMTAHLKQGGARLATASSVAHSIVKAVSAGRPVVYAPGQWALIMWVIRHLPRLLFNKADI